jgi:P-type Ca2+ transporter type 2C
MEKMIEKPYMLTTEETVKRANTDQTTGLRSEEAKKRLSEFGKNVIESGEGVSAFKILVHNLNNVIVYLLFFASIVSFFMGDTVEGVAIIIAILIAVLTGFVSEYKAQKSVESLQKMIKTVTKVKRDGSISEIDSENLAMGDLLFIETGDLITADARIVSSKNFATIESALTGESEAVDKDHDFIGEEDTPIGDRLNMVYMGTAATRGNAYAVITATGMDTEIGNISKLIDKKERTATPLEKQLDRMGKTLILFSAAVALVVIVFGILTGREIYEMIHIGVILAVAAVPEALPAVSTITLALGMRTMASHNALVKSLPAVETLGSTTVICTDKTGTLTRSEMTVKSIYMTDGTLYKVEGTGYIPEGGFFEKRIDDEDQPIDPNENGALSSLIIAGVLSSNASIKKEDDAYKVMGDPTEGGIIVLGKKASIDRNKLEEEGYRRIGEIPFDSSVKYMATAYQLPQDNKIIYLKGAPDVLADMATLDENQRQKLVETNERFAAEGMRVLAVGVSKDYGGDGSEASINEVIGKGIEMLGLVGIIDPPREDVKQAIRETQEAGIRVIMITGDHPRTAKTIAEQVGIDSTGQVITGREMDKMSDEELAEKIIHTSIFARVSSENKIHIVNALNIDNEVTAMTGDGVNDAPALKAADIGVAMGIRGTEVARDASDMILLDDRYSTIEDAVREGRVIFDNIEKFVYFLFSCNVIEILVVFLTIILGMPLPVLALQILWLNLVVDVFPAISLAWEPGEPDIMKRKPRDPQESIINRPFLMKILGNGFIIGLGSFAVFSLALFQGFDVITARTMAFTTMAFGQFMHVFNVRQKDTFGLNRSVLKNRYLLGALLISGSLQLAAVYLPVLNKVIGTVPITAGHWVYIITGSVLPTLAIQGFRIIRTKS